MSARNIASHAGKRKLSARYRAARTAFARSIAIVIGPTPPGTGVRRPARSAASGATSPTRPSSVRVMPDVDHGRPSFTQSRAARGRHADRGDDARRRGRPRRRDRACASGRSSRSRAAGAAAARPACRRCRCGRSRPRSRPASSTPYSSSSASTPSGVPATWPGVPRRSWPAFSGWKPSTSLTGSIARITRALVDARPAAAAGRGCRRRRRRRSARRRASSSSASVVVAAAGGRAPRSRPRAEALCLARM